MQLLRTVALDIILKQIYLNESQQHFLYNLKCAGPEEFKDHRFVKYYKKKAAFCNPNSAMRMAPNEVQLSSFGESIGNIHLSLTAGPGCIIVIVLSVICMILFVIVAFKWRNQQRERLERKRRLFEYYEYE